jgi:peptide deformylase
MAQQDTDQQDAGVLPVDDEGYVVDTEDCEERENAWRERGTSRPITVVGNPVLHKECRKVFVYDCQDDEGVRHVGVVCNPKLVDLPAERRRLDDSNEGCLSVPTAYASLARPDYAEVTGQDERGNPIKVRGTGYFARCLQHETDHLYGYLYIDRLSKRDRKDALRQMAENEPRYPVVAND